MSSNFYCPLVWNAVAIRNNGDYRVCCYSNVTAQGGILQDEHGRPLNLKSTPIDEIKNHPLLKEVRKSFLAGKWHSACERCKTEESFGQKSGRDHALSRVEDSDFYSQIVQKTASDGSILTSDFDTQEMDIRFGNKCNLSCRSCSPTDSTGWYKNWYELGHRSFVDRGVLNEITKSPEGRIYPVKDNYSWFENVQFKNVLPKNIAGIRHIYFAGGEPLLSKEHQQFLQALIESGHSKSICLEYNTNLTVLPDIVLDLWKHFQFIGVGVSMDGFGKFHEYLRYPGKFSVMEKNLLKLESCDLPLRAWIACTVSLLNLSHLPDFLIWKEQQKFKRVGNRFDKPPVSVHLLHWPRHLNLRSLPRPAKNLIAQRVKDGMARIDSHPDFSADRKPMTFKMLEGLVDYMFSQDFSEQWPFYWYHTKRLDEVSGQSFADLDEELAALLESESLHRSHSSP